jgi:acyl-CoA synthetase (AMP-forming)/AMP-acid ligase II
MPVIKVAQDLVRTVTVLTRTGLLAPLRPDKYVRMAAAISREAMNATTGITLASVRCPDRVALVDERGTLTWAELEARINALAAGLTALPGGPPATIGILCRNHRGFVEALAAAGKIGADVLLLNTGFAGPQLSEVLTREGSDLIVLDEEFESLLDESSSIDRVLGWTDRIETEVPTVEGLIKANLGQRAPVRRRAPSAPPAATSPPSS